MAEGDEEAADLHDRMAKLLWKASQNQVNDRQVNLAPYFELQQELHALEAKSKETTKADEYEDDGTW